MFIMADEEKHWSCSWEDCYDLVRENDIVLHVEDHVENLRKEKSRYICKWRGCPRSISDKPFGERYMLLRHMRLHTKETPYKCDFCERAFTTQEQRRRHEDTHTGRRGYFCAVCGKCFARTSERTKCERAHKGVMFTCADCGKSYCDAGTLRHHRQSRHPEQYRKQRSDSCNEEGIIATSVHDLRENGSGGSSSVSGNVGGFEMEKDIKLTCLNSNSASNEITSGPVCTATSVGGIVMLVGVGEDSPPDSISSSSTDEGVVEHLLLSNSGASLDSKMTPQSSFADLLDIDNLLPNAVAAATTATPVVTPVATPVANSLPPISSFTKQALLDDFYLSKDGALDLTGGLVMHDEIDDHHPHPPSVAGDSADAVAPANFTFASLLNLDATPVAVTSYGDSCATSGIQAGTIWTLNLSANGQLPTLTRALIVKRENIVGFL